MNLGIDKALAQGLNEGAQAIVDNLVVEPDELVDPIGIFKPNYLLSTVNLTKKEIPDAPIRPVIDLSGKEVARFFPDLEPEIGIVGQHHSKFIEICSEIYQLQEFNSMVSLTFIVENVFSWIRKRYQNLTAKTMTEQLINACNSEIREQEIWLPIAGTNLEIEIDMNKVVLKPITDDIWRKWVSEWNVRQPGEIERIEKILTRYGIKYNCAAVIKLTAEPIKAVETAIEETEESLSLLRYFSNVNFNPSMYTLCTIAGKEHIERPQFMFLRNDLLIRAGSVETNLRWKHPWTINTELLSKMKERGLDILVNLNGKEESERTEFQNSLLKALNIYSKSSLAQNLNDKLLYVVVALENLLLKNNTEPLQKNISERIALLIGKSLDDRLFIIKNYKEAYTLRSAAVHHGATLTETKAIENFLRDAWWTLNKLIEKADDFLTKEEMINYIDDIKFS
jgi:hypothetical protein